MQLVQDAARGGSMQGMALMGMFRSVGIGMERDERESLLWYSLAVAATMDPEPLAEMALANKFAHGLDGVRRDCHVAVGMLGPAAGDVVKALHQGESPLQAERLPLSEGTDMQQDKLHFDSDEVVEAERYHADAGELEAQLYLGDLYQNGLRNAPVDHAKAAHYYGQAANQGSAPAKVALAKMAVLGQIDAVDNSTLLRYLNETSDDAESVALHAHLYAHGAVVPQDEDRALRLFQHATRMKGATPSTYTNTAIMLEASNANWTEVQPLYRYAAARYDLPALFHVARGTPEAPCMERAAHFRALVLNSIDSKQSLRGYDCFLANRPVCAFAALIEASECGSPLASADLAYLLQTRFDADGAFRSAPAEVAPTCPRPPVGLFLAGQAAALLPMCDLRPLRVWNRDWYWRYYQTRALEMHHFLSPLDTGLLAMQAADLVYRGVGGPHDAAQVVRYFRVAAAANNSEGVYSLAWAHETGYGMQRNLGAARALYQRLIDETDTVVERLIGWTGLAKVWWREQVYFGQ